MPFKCCVASCKSNYDSTDASVTTFAFPDEQKEPDLRARWVKFVNRKDWIPGNNARVCINHFEPQYVKVGDGPNFSEVHHSLYHNGSDTERTARYKTRVL